MSAVTCGAEFTLTTGFFVDAAGTTSNRTSSGYAAPATTESMASGRPGIRNDMERQVYDKRSFRNLPRERCALADLFGAVIGPCKGLIHLHHVDPEDPDSRLLPCCNSHHHRLHAALRALLTPSEPEWKVCPHRPGTHRYPGAKEACERRLNGVSEA